MPDPEVTMPRELEAIRVAAFLVREYGDQASLEAGRRKNAAIEKGDVGTQPDWARVAATVEDIQSQLRLLGGRPEIGEPADCHSSA
jgi:hypothetical protein